MPLKKKMSNGMFSTLVLFPIKVLYFKFLHAMWLQSRENDKLYSFNDYNRLDRFYRYINIKFFKHKTMFWLLARTFYLPLKAVIYLYIIYLMLFSSFLGFIITVLSFFIFTYGTDIFNKWYAKTYMTDGFTKGKYINQDIFFEFFGLYCFSVDEEVKLQKKYPFLHNYFWLRQNGVRFEDCRDTFLDKSFKIIPQQLSKDDIDTIKSYGIAHDIYLDDETGRRRYSLKEYD